MTLKALIHRMIAAEGPMPLDRYMSLCLAHPELGYYMKGEPVGARGAFTTAPEISQMFGEMIGAWCHAVWSSMGSPEKFYWVELGPGRGTLFADMLRVAKMDQAFLRAAHGVLVESSPLLQQAQRTRLKDSKIPIAWLSTVEELPAGARLLVVANEFFDALPIRHAIKGPRGWHERMIGHFPAPLEGMGSTKQAVRGLTFGLSPHFLSDELIPELLQKAPEGSIVEFSPARDAAMATLAARIKEQGGAALIVDYGYEGPRLGETFQAMLAHGFVDPLACPGDADLTAHVNFSALKRASASLSAYGPVPQGEFLARLGLHQRAARLKMSASPEQSADIAAAAHRLTHPDAMGDLFKALAICQKNFGPPPGFVS